MDEIKLEVELADGKAARELQEMMRKQLGLRVRVVPVTPGRAAAARRQGAAGGRRAPGQVVGP